MLFANIQCEMWRLGFFLSAVLHISAAQFLDGFGKFYSYIDSSG